MADLELLMESGDGVPQLLDDDQGKPAASEILSTSTKPEDEFKPVKTRKRKAKDVYMAEKDEALDTVSSIDTSVTRHKKRARGEKTEQRAVPVPSHRVGPMKQNWLKIVTTIVQHLHCDVQYNTKSRQVLLRKNDSTEDIGNLQKAADFVRAFVLGFDIDDAMALVRLDDLFIESFEIADVKPLKGEHLSRAIGRVAGKDGRTKFTIENVTKTRIVLADTKISILGSYQNCRVARHAVCNLIMGTPPSKVYGNLRSMSSRAMEKL